MVDRCMLQVEHQSTKEELESATAQVAALNAQLDAQQVRLPAGAQPPVVDTVSHLVHSRPRLRMWPVPVHSCKRSGTVQWRKQRR